MAETKRDIIRRLAKACGERASVGLTLDSGALTAFGRDKRRVIALLITAVEAGMPLRAPAVAIAEFWRGEHAKEVTAFLEAVCVPDTLARAKKAGEALAAIAPKKNAAPSVVDAIASALAAEQGDRILTSGINDLASLAAWFGNLTVLHA
jgi:hypothetical protein